MFAHPSAGDPSHFLEGGGPADVHKKICKAYIHTVARTVQEKNYFSESRTVRIMKREDRKSNSLVFFLPVSFSKTHTHTHNIPVSIYFLPE
jgi:hypothetical protein